MTLREKLDLGLEQLDLSLPEAAREKLLDYLTLIGKWNRVHNLTAVREPEEIVTQHLLDSLTILPFLGQVKNLIDIGSGAGLPGLPLAIARPELRVSVLDSSLKKVAFMRQAKLELSLPNVTVVSERARLFRPLEGYAVVISRAFGDLADFIDAALHLVAPGGAMLAMKGVYPFEEIERLPRTVELQAVTPLALPFSRAKRHMVVLAPAKP